MSGTQLALGIVITLCASFVALAAIHAWKEVHK